jgi:hypothetical protein
MREKKQRERERENLYIRNEQYIFCGRIPLRLLEGSEREEGCTPQC